MTAGQGAPVTRATEAAAALGLTHEVRVIEGARSTEEAADRIGVPADQLLKTIVIRRADDDYLLALVPGPRQIDWPKLRRHIGVSRVSLPDADMAREATGYERGTITPLGASRPWPVLADASIVGSGRVSVGGGAHGVAIVADADELLAAVEAETLDLT